MFSYKNKSGCRGMTTGGAEGGNVEILDQHRGPGIASVLRKNSKNWWPNIFKDTLFSFSLSPVCSSLFRLE